MLAWVIITPLGFPVDPDGRHLYYEEDDDNDNDDDSLPEVYMMMQGVSGLGATGAVSSSSAFLPRVSTLQNEVRVTEAE